MHGLGFLECPSPVEFFVSLRWTGLATDSSQSAILRVFFCFEYSPHLFPFFLSCEALVSV